MRDQVGDVVGSGLGGGRLLDDDLQVALVVLDPAADAGETVVGKLGEQFRCGVPQAGVELAAAVADERLDVLLAVAPRGDLFVGQYKYVLDQIPLADCL